MTAARFRLVAAVALMIAALWVVPAAQIRPVPGVINLGQVTGILAAANGGTGQSSYTIGDLLYASSSTALSKLIDAAVGQVLVSGGAGAAPAYSAIPTVTSIFPSGSKITAGTDDTTVTVGDVTRVRYQATITPASGGAGNCATQAAGFKAAALTADCVVATLPAGVKIVGAYADVTAGFTCSGTCSGTKVFRMGISAGGTEIFATSLDVTSTGQFGLADANMGSGMTRAAQIQGGYLPSWSATTTITARFTSGTGNWGDASATFVNAGSIKFTLVTELEK